MCCACTSHSCTPAAPGTASQHFPCLPTSNIPQATPEKAPVQEPHPPGSPRGLGCQAAVRGPAGPAWGCQLCLVFLPALEPQTPSRHGGARILGKAQRPYTAGWAARGVHVLSCALGPHSTRCWHGALPMRLPQCRAPACQRALLTPTGLLCGPRAVLDRSWLLGYTLLPNCITGWGLEGGPGLPRGTLARRDIHVPHVPSAP